VSLKYKFFLVHKLLFMYIYVCMYYLFIYLPVVQLKTVLKTQIIANIIIG
jgi:hypothetical protein